MTDNEKFNIGDKIKEVFKSAGLTQLEVAAILNIAHSGVARLLNGTPFGKNTSKTWEEAFGFRQNWLLTGEGEMFTSDHPKIFDYKKGGDNYGKVSSSQGPAAGVVNGGADMRTYVAEKIIKENGDTELYGDAQGVIIRLEIENKSLKQRIMDLESIVASKDELIASLKETIALLKKS